MNGNITLDEARRIVAVRIVEMPWVEKYVINPINEDITVHAVGTGAICTVKVLGITAEPKGFVMRVCDQNTTSIIMAPDEVEASFNMYVRPLLIRKYFVKTANRIIRLAADALEECGKDVPWDEGTIREGSYKVGRYINFGDTKIRFTYPKTTDDQAFSFSIDSSDTKYEPAGLAKNIGYIEDLVMSRVSKFIHPVDTDAELPVADVSPINENDKTDMQKDLDAICGDKPVVITSVDILKALIDKYHS